MTSEPSIGMGETKYTVVQDPIRKTDRRIERARFILIYLMNSLEYHGLEGLFSSPFLTLLFQRQLLQVRWPYPL